MEFLNPRRSVEAKREELSKEIKAIRDEREKLEKEKGELKSIEQGEEVKALGPSDADAPKEEAVTVDTDQKKEELSDKNLVKEKETAPIESVKEVTPSESVKESAPVKSVKETTPVESAKEPLTKE